MTGTIVVSQLGARRHYAVPRILASVGRLAQFYTDVCAVKGWPRLLQRVPPKAMPRAVRRLAGRIPRGVPPDRITSFTAFGLVSALKRLRGRNQADEVAAAIRGGKALSERVVRCGFHGAVGVYGFSGECLEMLAAARRQGCWTVVDQVIAPRGIVDQLAVEEEQRFPGWQLPSKGNPFAMPFAEREKAEWRLADLVLCPSEFVRDGVITSGGDPARCAVVPFGVDAPGPVGASRRSAACHGRDRPLRVLTVGEVSLRKGSPYVLQAARLLRDRATFRMVGPCSVLPGARAALEAAVELTGPIPRSEMAAVFDWADVFLLPSICEGSAMAVYEALSAGLPVITTVNTGTVVRDGIEGFIVPIRDSREIVERIEQLADPDLRRQLAANAAARAADHTVKRYGERLLAALSAVTAGQSGNLQGAARPVGGAQCAA